MTEITQEAKEQALRVTLFSVCETKEHLREWVKQFLGIEVPDCTVCLDDSEIPTDNPNSNSNPMDLLWEVYSAAVEGKDPKKSWYLYYAARDTWKSLIASIIEVLCMFHLDRDVAHLAAVLSQAKNVQRYLKKYFRKPVLRDFLTSKNEMTVEVTRYEKGDRVISPVELKKLSPEEAKSWSPVVRFVQIIVATLSGTNSLHCSMVIMDELDLAPPKPVEEAMMIASPGEVRREMPIVLMTSSRKFSIGLVQKHIDNAAKLGINLRHWNLIDATAPCPSERHLPMLPQIPIYYSEKTLSAISKDEFEASPPAVQEVHREGVGYQGCLKNCAMFAMCRGRLATKQTSTSRMLKSVDATQQAFNRVSPEVAQAQLMCWKPSKEGMIFSALDYDRHVVTAAFMAELITGESHPADMTKADLIKLLIEHDALWAAGLDWGFSHPFAGTLAAVVGQWMFILDAWEISELDNSQQISVCEERLKPYDPFIYADTAYPGMIKDFKKRGFQMREWKKYAGSVLDGIEAVRSKIRPPKGKPQMYFLQGEGGPELLFKRMSQYHWKTDSAGTLTNIPDDTDDDGVDSCRYLTMNVFSRSSGIQIAAADPAGTGTLTPLKSPNPTEKAYDPTVWARQVIHDIMGTSMGDEFSDEMEPEKKPRSGGIHVLLD